MDSDGRIVLPQGVRQWFDSERSAEEIIADLEGRIEAAVAHRNRTLDDELDAIAEDHCETIRQRVKSPN